MPELADTDDLQDLYGRPGFLLRRANQIAAAIFLEAASELQITTTQYGALIALRARGAMDQTALARLLRLDRSTTGLVITNLENRGAIERTSDPADKRRRILSLTHDGRAQLERIMQAAKGVPALELAVFTPDEAIAFLTLLVKFVEGFDPELHPGEKQD